MSRKELVCYSDWWKGHLWGIWYVLSTSPLSPWCAGPCPQLAVSKIFAWPVNSSPQAQIEEPLTGQILGCQGSNLVCKTESTKRMKSGEYLRTPRWLKMERNGPAFPPSPASHVFSVFSQCVVHSKRRMLLCSYSEDRFNNKANSK